MMTSTSTNNNKTSMKQLSILAAIAITLLSTGVSAQPAELEKMFTNGNANGNSNGANNNLDDDDAPVQVIFKYNKNNAQNAKNEAKKLGRLGIDIPGLGVASVATNNRSFKAMQKNPNFENAEVDGTFYAIGDDTPMLRGAEQGERQLAESVPYGITMVQADQVDVANPIKICVVDTGYTPGHPDLPSSNAAGYSPYSGQTWDNDGDSHGTHVAGTIGAIRGNGIGVDSVLGDPSKFDFFIGKGLSDSGSGSFSGVLSACQACADAGAKVINMSLGGGDPGTTFANGMRDIYNAGVLIVAAAGNGGNGSFSYPASLPTVMSVAAVDSSENRRTFSQYNTQVEIAGPGSGTLSTVPPTGYASYSGTSMASPHVAGVAALVWSHYPECTNVQIRNVLLKSAKDKGAAGCDIFYGFGIVQAKDALDLLDTYGCEAGGNDTPTSGGAVGGCAQADATSLPPFGTPAPITPSPTPAPATPGPTPAPATGAPVTLDPTPAPATPAPITPAPTPSPTPFPTTGPPTTCGAQGDSCVFNSDCCGNKCRGPNGRKSCK